MSPASHLRQRRSPNGKPPAVRRPAFVLAAAFAAFAAAFLAVSPAARADGERVRPEKIPSPAGDVLQREAAGSREVQYYRADDGFFVHYTLPNGLRLETKVNRDGTRLVTSPTANQPELGKAETRRAFEHYQAERARAVAIAEEEHRRAEAAAVAAAEEERRRVALAEEERRREEETVHRAVERERELQRLRDEEAARDHARRLSEKEAAEYWGGRRYEKIGLDDMPLRARRELHDLTHDTTDQDFYRFRRAGDWFYAAQFTTGTGRRLEVVVNEGGRLIDRVEVWDRPHAHKEVSDLDLGWDRQHKWDHDRDEVRRYWVPEGARRRLDELSAGSDDVDFYRLRIDGRTLYAARYTSFRGRRVESRVTPDGDLVETLPLFEIKRDRPVERTFATHD